MLPDAYVSYKEASFEELYQEGYHISVVILSQYSKDPGNNEPL